MNIKLQTILKLLIVLEMSIALFAMFTGDTYFTLDSLGILVCVIGLNMKWEN